jgi:hypothetical protein
MGKHLDASAKTPSALVRTYKSVVAVLGTLHNITTTAEQRVTSVEPARIELATSCLQSGASDH